MLTKYRNVDRIFDLMSVMKWEVL